MAMSILNSLCLSTGPHSPWPIKLSVNFVRYLVRFLLAQTPQLLSLPVSMCAQNLCVCVDVFVSVHG